MMTDAEIKPDGADTQMENPENYAYTNEELVTLVVDYRAGKVFTDRAVKDVDSLDMVFMPLALMKPEQLAAFKVLEPFLIYEYFEKAGPRSINGNPIFFSFRVVLARDRERFMRIYDAAEDDDAESRERLLVAAAEEMA